MSEVTWCTQKQKSVKTRGEINMASIRERNGAYFIMVSTGYDTTDKQIRKTMTWKPDEGMTPKQIEKALNEQTVMFEKKVMSGQVLDGDVTFAEFTERWCRDYGEVQLSPKTYARYQSMLRRILPAIGHMRLDKLQPHHLMELYKDMGDDMNHRGLSFLATDEFMEVFEEKGYTKETLSRLTLTHINTIYNIFKNKPVAERTSRKVCGVLGILFEEAFEPSKPIKGLSNRQLSIITDLYRLFLIKRFIGR
jgi:integrase